MVLTPIEVSLLFDFRPVLYPASIHQRFSVVSARRIYLLLLAACVRDRLSLLDLATCHAEAYQQVPLADLRLQPDLPDLAPVWQ